MNDVAINDKATKKIGGITGKGFMPGQSGNPSGRPKNTPITDIYKRMLDDGATQKEIENAMRAALKSRGKGSQSVSALKEIADRVEGRPTERVEHTGPDGEPLQLQIVMVAK